MVPGTANGLVDDETFGQRAVVMRALRSHGENIRTAAHQQDIVLANMAEQLAVLESIWSHSQCEVGTP
jgi:hypothetical protein